MMLINSVAMFTIACSFFNFSFGEIFDNELPSTPPITLNQLIQNHTAYQSRVMSQIKQNSELISDYQEAVRRNGKLKAMYFDANSKFEFAQSRIMELKNSQNNLNEKYEELEKSFSINEKQMEILNDQLDNLKNYINKVIFDELECLKGKHSRELYDLNTKYDQLNEEINICIDKKKQKDSYELYDEVNTEIDQLKENKKFFEGARINEWIKNPGKLVPKMVSIGFDLDRKELVVSRAYHNGKCLPGKAKPKESVSYVTYDDAEHMFHNFEVLLLTNYDWVKSKNGNVPSNAVESGCTTDDGEILYIGRTTHDDVSTAGKIQSSRRGLLIPFCYKEEHYSEYEVLVQN